MIIGGVRVDEHGRLVPRQKGGYIPQTASQTKPQGRVESMADVKHIPAPQPQLSPLISIATTPQNGESRPVHLHKNQSTPSDVTDLTESINKGLQRIESELSRLKVSIDSKLEITELRNAVNQISLETAQIRSVIEAKDVTKELEGIVNEFRPKVDSIIKAVKDNRHDEELENLLRYLVEGERWMYFQHVSEQLLESFGKKANKVQDADVIKQLELMNEFRGEAIKLKAGDPEHNILYRVNRVISEEAVSGEKSVTLDHLAKLHGISCAVEFGCQIFFNQLFPRSHISKLYSGE